MRLPDKILFGLTETEYRPCYVSEYSRKKGATKKKALFHKWSYDQEPVAPGYVVGSHPGGQRSLTVGIVELEDGTMRRCHVEDIQFLDTKDIMCQISYGEEEEHEKEF